MSGAGEAVAAAVVAVLSGIAPVYDRAPPRAVFPYIVFSDSPVTDWSTKTARGREIRLALTIWDDGEHGARIASLIAQIEDAIAQLPRALPGWQVASLVFLRSLISRDVSGPSAGLVEFRVRVLAA